MPKSHRSYPPEFRQQMVELVRSRRRPGRPEPPRVPWHGTATSGFLSRFLYFENRITTLEVRTNETIPSVVQAIRARVGELDDEVWPFAGRIRSPPRPARVGPGEVIWHPTGTQGVS